MKIRNAIIFFTVLIIIFLSASTYAVISLIKKDNEKLSKTDSYDFLTQGEWKSYSNENEESLVVSFRENGEYAFFCECGEPVGDSDLYDKFLYDKKEKVIRLTGPVSDILEIKVKYYDKFFLVLEYPEEGTLIFQNKKSPVLDELLGDAEKYINTDNSVLLSFLEYNDNILKVAPYNYDRDSHKLFKDNIFEIKASENLKCKSVSVTVTKGNAVTEVKNLNASDFENIGKYYTHGYLTFNKNNEAAEIVFYGATEIY